MGQKIHPTGFRLAVTRDWGSRWFASSKDFSGMLHEDLKVREYLKKRLAHASISRVIIDRPAKNARITLFSARPGVVIGKKGEDIESLKRELQKIVRVPVHVLRATSGDASSMTRIPTSPLPEHWLPLAAPAASW